MHGVFGPGKVSTIRCFIGYNVLDCLLLNCYGQTYHKPQKFIKRKILQFTGFHSNIGKTFAGLAPSVLKESLCSKDSTGKFFRSLTKICETFLPLNFCCSR